MVCHSLDSSETRTTIRIYCTLLSDKHIELALAVNDITSVYVCCFKQKLYICFTSSTSVICKGGFCVHTIQLAQRYSLVAIQRGV